jgi:hypothetical protein
MTDLVALQTSVSTLNTNVGLLTTESTTLFAAVVSLKDTVSSQITDAVATSENAALEPMISMTASFVSLANIIVVNLTPEA